MNIYRHLSALLSIVVVLLAGCGSGSSPATSTPTLAITTVSVPGGALGSAYSAVLIATGGTGTGYSWSVVSGALPGGLSLSTGGAISGTPTAFGSFSATVRVVDSGANAATATLALTVAPPAVSISTVLLPGGTLGSVYSASLAATGGTGSGYSWSVSAGALPGGLSLSSAGAITGTPTAYGSFAVTVKVVDSPADSVTANFTLVVGTPALVISTAALPNGAQTVAYTTTLVASGGADTGYSWSVAAGIIPTGLTLTSAGTLSGTPSVSGTFALTLKVTDPAANAATAAFTLVVTTNTPDMGTLYSPSTSTQFKMVSVSSGLVLGVSGQSQTAGASMVQETDAGTPDEFWHMMPLDYAATHLYFNIENLLTHQVLGISGASKTTGAQVLQWADNGTADHEWQIYLLADGNYLLKNLNSGLYLQNTGTSASATIDQAARPTTGAACSCQEWTLVATNTSPYPAPRTVVGNGIYVHDPYMLVDPTGTYWLYGTHQTLASSPDLTTFTAYTGCTTSQKTGYAPNCPIIGPDFPSWTGVQTPGGWNNGANTDMWAPSLMAVSGTYYLYYALPWLPSTGAEALIGLATGPSPTGPWTDKGWVVESWTSSSAIPSGFGFTKTTFNAIDPAPFLDASGNWWMVFGSWSDGIRVFPLDPSTGKQLAGSTMTIIASRGTYGEEGPFIYYWNGYYYYFAPVNVCCEADAPYRIIVGRATAPAGPYYDRGGLPLTSGANTLGGATILLSTHGNIIGPGGQSVFTDMVNGVATPTLVYHYYDGNNNGVPTLGINRLGFTADGWPYIQ